MARQITYSLRIDWSGNGGFTDTNEDVSNYLTSANGDESVANPDESSFASSGYTAGATFTLVNKDQLFSPSNTSGPLYASIGGGKYYQKRVEFKATIAGTEYIVFQGLIKSLTESARSASDAGMVTLKCVGGEDAFLNMRLISAVSTTQTFYEQGKDEGQLIAKTLELCGLADGTNYVSQDYSGGTKTIDRGLFTIPWYWLDAESPIEDCWKLAAACGGRFYFNTADGKFYYKNAQFYGFGTSGTSQFTADLSNSVRISPIYGDKELYESVRVVAKPRQIGDSQVLWQPDNIPTIFAGETIEISAKITTPVYAYTGYELRAMSTGGFDKLSELDIAVTYNSQSVKFVITNNSAHFLFLREFKISGYPIEGGEAIEFYKSSSDSFWTTRNGKERAITDNPYIQTYEQAQALGLLLFDRQSTWIGLYKVEKFKGNAFGRAGERMTVSNSVLGISSEAIITKQSWALGYGQFDQDFECYGTANLYGGAPGDYLLIGTNSCVQSKDWFY